MIPSASLSTLKKKFCNADIFVKVLQNMANCSDFLIRCICAGAAKHGALRGLVKPDEAAGALQDLVRQNHGGVLPARRQVREFPFFRSWCVFVFVFGLCLYLYLYLVCVCVCICICIWFVFVFVFGLCLYLYLRLFI